MFKGKCINQIKKVSSIKFLTKKVSRFISQIRTFIRTDAKIYSFKLWQKSANNHFLNNVYRKLWYFPARTMELIEFNPELSKILNFTSVNCGQCRRNVLIFNMNVYILKYFLFYYSNIICSRSQLIMCLSKLQTCKSWLVLSNNNTSYSH